MFLKYLYPLFYKEYVLDIPTVELVHPPPMIQSCGSAALSAMQNKVEIAISFIQYFICIPHKWFFKLYQIKAYKKFVGVIKPFLKTLC